MEANDAQNNIGATSADEFIGQENKFILETNGPIFYEDASHYKTLDPTDSRGDDSNNPCSGLLSDKITESLMFMHITAIDPF